MAHRSVAMGRYYCQARSRDASADTLPRFQYEPLEPRCIRILELQPGRRSDAFLSKFIVANIDNEFEYDALSYMWGDATPADRVVIDGAVVPTGWNLTRALEHLREFAGSKPLRIWIDAICINQESLEERAEQVAMMRSIYHNASCVRIWINEPSIDAESAAVAALKDFQPSPDAEHRGLGDDPLFWNPLVLMFQNGYWNRIWM